MFKYKKILVTGGTGSFGKKFINKILNEKNIIKIIIFSRDEFKQSNMNLEFSSHKNFKKLRFFLGDIRDKDRLRIALKDVDCVVHAAALKQVPAAEYNPMEFIKTNVLGAQNLVETCLESGVKNIIALSTDKASSPINLYGATKLCSDKLMLTANNIKGKQNIKFSVVRYGNVLGSRGSVLPLFLKCEKYFPITHRDMTRFNITLDQSINMVLWVLNNNIGGEIFVPKIPSLKIVDLAKAIDNKKKIKIIGVREGEKIHEELVSIHEGMNTIEFKNYYAILNNFSKKRILKYKSSNTNFKRVKSNFSYNSLENNVFLNINQIKKLLKNY